MSFPAYGSTSAAGSQERRRSGPISETCPFTHQPTRPPRKGRARGWHSNPAGPTQQDTPQTQVARFWYGLLDLTFLGDYICLSAADLLIPSPLRVNIWHQTHLSSAAACQSHADRISATRRRGINFSLRTPWKWELAFFQCRTVLTILYRPFFLSWLVRIWLSLFGDPLRTTLSPPRVLVANSLWIMKST